MSPRPTTTVPPRTRRLGVVVVDPLPVVRAGLTMLIDDRPTWVIAETGTADEFGDREPASDARASSSSSASASGGITTRSG